MKICFMCDLHLPSDTSALQYDVLQWACEDIQKKATDCIVYVGDVTCDGNEDVYRAFVEKMDAIGKPFLYIPGNSDLRSEKSREIIKNLSSPLINDFDGFKIFAVNDCCGKIDDEVFSAIDEADDNSIVFMHHPVTSLSEECKGKMIDWRVRHKDTKLFCGHLHESFEKDNTICLQALDPDKAIGESPCILYYDTETRSSRKEYYFCPVPTDLYSHFGISCYDIKRDIEFAFKRKLKNIELRPSCADFDKDELAKLVDKWRKFGGENLSLHLPDIRYEDGFAVVDDKFKKCIEIAKTLKADRLVQHVPKVSAKVAKDDASCLDKITNLLSEYYNTIEHDVVIGVENMHMTDKDTPDDNRRFGHVPEECLELVIMLSEKCRHRIGINFDIGHARNNAPYSQMYQISTWFSMVGKYIVGYHMHQVTYDNGVFENHMPITDIYGKLISYGSFFKCWSKELINKAPVIFEMRPDNAYKTTFETFDKHCKRKVFDFHSHTYYSNCGRDNPKDLIEAAIQNGVSVLGITDHNHGIRDRKEQYIDEMRSFADKYSDRIKILSGIEIATLPQYYDLKSNDEVANFDYCLIEHITDKQSIAGGKFIEFCNDIPIACGIAHTDLFEYCDMYGYDYAEFFKSLADNNIFWEMNVTYDTIHKYKEHKYVLDLMTDKSKQEIVKKSGVYISVGSDSHRYEDYVGFKIHQMYDFLKENGFKTADELLLK